MRALIAGVAGFIGSLWSIDSWPAAGRSEPRSAQALRNRRGLGGDFRVIHPAEVGRELPAVGQSSKHGRAGQSGVREARFARVRRGFDSRRATSPGTRAIEVGTALRANLRITDTVVVCGAVILAQYVRFGSAPTAPGYVNQYVTAYSALLVAIWLLALTGFRARSPRYIGAGIEEYRRVVAASFGTFGAIAMAELLVKLEISRGYLAVALPAGVLGLLLSRCMWRNIVAHQRVDGPISNCGAGDRGKVCGGESRQRADRQPDEWISGRGSCHNRVRPATWRAPHVNNREIPIIGGETYALQAIRGCGADTVAIAGTEDFGFQGIRRLIWELEADGR